jgi:hypothetical protein
MGTIEEDVRALRADPNDPELRAKVARHAREIIEEMKADIAEGLRRSDERRAFFLPVFERLRAREMRGRRFW